jgi:hypothetical protein
LALFEENVKIIMYKINILQISKYSAGWSSQVARQAHNLKVGGSNPPPATNFQRPLNQDDRGFLLI